MSLSFLRRIAFCASVGALFGSGSVARASDYVVANTNDSGTGSLRAAIATANSNAAADTISFNPSLAGKTITLTSGELSISTSISIEGPEGTSGALNISGNNNSRVFSIAAISPAFSDVVSLSNLTISGGNSDNIGAGVYNGGTLFMSNCTLADNTTPMNGGGLYSSGGPVTLSNCTFARNHTRDGGAGFCNAVGLVKLINCTFYANVSSGSSGGGLLNNSGDMSLDSCTFSANSAGDGAAIYNFGTPLKIKNTIIGESVLNDSSSGGSIVSQGYNLFKTGNGFVGNGTTDKSATDLGLDVLADNGGPTETVALLGNSPALDAGSATGQDQRGVARPIDLAGVANADNGSDIGAYERRDESGASAFVVTTTDDSSADDGQTSLREAIVAANAAYETNRTPVQITFNSRIFGKAKKTITLSNSLPATTGALTIVGPSGPGAGTTIDGGGYNVFDTKSGSLTVANLSIVHALLGVITEGGSFTLRSCTISANNQFGHAVFVNPNYMGTLENCTISGNPSGGVYASVGATVSMKNCTVTGNGIRGVFVYNDNVPTTLNISNCIVAGNEVDIQTYASPSNGNAVIHNAGYNLVGNNAGVETIFPAGNPNANHDRVGTSSQPLAAGFDPAGLADNGGPTPTIALLGSSPAVNTGNTTLSTDQRGATRDLLPDIGAYELGEPTVNLTLTPSRPTTTDTLTATASTSPAVPVGSYRYTYTWTRTHGTTATTVKTTTSTTSPTDTLDLSKKNIGDKGDTISVAVTVTDSGNSATSSPVVRSVRVGNTAPSVSLLTVTGSAGQSVSAQILATDADSDVLTYSVASGHLPTGLSLDTSTGQISGTPTSPANNVPVSVRVGDGTASTLAVVTFDIVEAKSLVVNLYNDVQNPYDGKTSLREAILASDLRARNNAITFDAAVFGVPRVIVLAGSPLALNANTTISGPAVGVTVSANNASRVFDVGVPRRITVSISNLRAISGRAAGNGGGFYVPFGSSLLLTNCTVSGNRAQTNGRGTGLGGAIFLDGNGVLSLNGCTLSDNVALGSGTGGALHIANGRTTLINCTLSGNSASVGTFNGGAVWTHSGVAMSSCTVASNTAKGNSSAGGVVVTGGALLAQNTIIAANTSGMLDIAGPFSSGGNNLIGSAESSTRFASTDLRGTSTAPLNPLLAPLGSNGGLSKTHALLKGSPAIDKGNTTLLLDERGVVRPQGSADDIGAFEAASASPNVRSLDVAPEAPADDAQPDQEQPQESPVTPHSSSGGSA